MCGENLFSFEKIRSAMVKMKKEILLKNWFVEYEGKPLPVNVPGDIVNDLMQNGILEDCLFGNNFKSAKWVHERDWIYSTEFVLSKEDVESEELCLRFDQIDTYAEITLNGRLLGKTDNMFRSFSFDVKGIAVEGKNTLSVKIVSIRAMECALHNEKYFACFDADRIMIRKPQCHFGWDWAPDFPGTGISGDVSLRIGIKGNIAGVQILTETSGAVSFIVETSYNNRDPLQEQTEGDVLVIRAERFPGAGMENAIEKRIEVFGSKNLVNFYFEEPQLWYPNGYGEQPLYRYEISLLRGGKEADKKTGRFGIRKIEVSETPYGENRRRFDFICNGVRVRVLGSNWVPASIFTGLVTREDYERLLDCAYKGGFNMLRVWGGGKYEKDDFYELCDEKGIMVWQDFMFSCAITPDDINEFCRKLEIEFAEQIKRLRNYACIAVWSGGNEMADSFRFNPVDHGKYIMHVTLPGMCYDLDGTRKYVWNSPYSCTDVGNDVTSGDCHNATLNGSTEEEIRDYRKLQWGKENNFDSECAVLGMCRLRSFKKFVPEENLWPQNEMWEDRLACNPYDEFISSFTERINLEVRALFGETNSLADYIKKSMCIHAEVLQDEIKYYRSFEYNTGLMNWMFNDTWGNATWAIVDYYLEKKPAYYAMKRAGKRRSLGVVYRKDGYFISLVNDTKESWTGTLRFAHEGLDGTQYILQESEQTLAPFEQKLVPIRFDDTIKNAYLYAKMGDIYDVYFYDFWQDKCFETDIRVSKCVQGKSADVTIQANKFARMVFIDLPEGVQVDMEDNYFDLPAGQTRTIRLTADREISVDEITVKTFAEEWTE